MAKQLRKIKPIQKRLLIDEAGGKCANPGCCNWRLHIHHIRHWAVYKTHDSEHMIAICPSCHDAVHHGSLKISDVTLYQWKGLDKPKRPDTVQIYVEPATELKLLTGTICISTTNDQAAVFQLSNSNQLKLRILDGDILQVSSCLQDQNGNEVLRVAENHVRVARDKNVKFEFRPGHARVTVPSSTKYVPDWLVQQVRVRDSEFATGGRIVAFDIEVIKPGLVRIQGCWPDGDVGVVITEKALSFCRRGNIQPLSMIGAGEGTVLKYAGPITSALFGFA